MAADLDLVRRLGAADHGLAVIATTRADGSVQASVVNAGVLDHPVTGRARRRPGRPRRCAEAAAGAEGRAGRGDVPRRLGVGRRRGPGLADRTRRPATRRRPARRCCGPSSRPPAAPTTTGTSSTGSWRRSGGSPCSSSRRGSRRTDPRGGSRTARCSGRCRFLSCCGAAVEELLTMRVGSVGGRVWPDSSTVWCGGHSVTVWPNSWGIRTPGPAGRRGQAAGARADGRHCPSWMRWWCRRRRCDERQVTGSKRLSC